MTDRDSGPIVLVVDDDPDTRELLTELIRARGYKPRCAGSVSEALYALERCRVALVITDYAMPGENGLALLRRLQRRPEWAVPAVLISGHELDGTLAQQAGDLGAEFLPKPIDLARLLVILTRVIEPSTRRADEDLSTRPPPTAPRGGVVEIVAPGRKRDPRTE